MITGVAPDPWTVTTITYSKHADACDSCVAGSVILRSRINPSEGENSANQPEILPTVLAKNVDWRGFPGDDRLDC